MSQVVVLGLGTANPPYSYTQNEVLRLIGYQRKSVHGIFHNSAIETRKLAISPDNLPQNDPDWFTEHYAKWAIKLAIQAATQAMQAAKLTIEDIDYIVATSCTGYLCPALGQVLAAELGLNARAKTASLIGMGCSAALPALERASEFVSLHSGAKALVVAAEVCSAAYWIDEDDLETAVGNAIFSDGASAAILTANAGDQKTSHSKLPRIERFATHSNREWNDLMGFATKGGRLRLTLSRKVPEAVIPVADAMIKNLLSHDKLSPNDIKHWLIHPGGRRILELAEQKWELQNRLGHSWSVLKEFGNMSSATILFVLEHCLQGLERPQVGEYGVLLAVGPGLTVEGALLRW